MRFAKQTDNIFLSANYIWKYSIFKSSLFSKIYLLMFHECIDILFDYSLALLRMRIFKN